jgi:hypothetical protein
MFSASTTDYTDEKGEIILKRLIKWNAISADTFMLTDENTAQNHAKPTTPEMLVRII